MRRIEAVLLAVSLLFASCANVAAREPVFDSSLTEEQMIQKIVDETKTPDGLNLWVTKHLRYRTDRTAADEWKDPKVTLTDGYGDCEDLALVYLYVLREMGFVDVYLMGVAKKSRNLGHVVCFFRETSDSDWLIASNDDKGYYRVQGRTLKDVMLRVGSMMRYGSDLEYQLANRYNKNIPKEEEAAYGLV